MKQNSTQTMGGVGALVVALGTVAFMLLVLLAPDPAEAPGGVPWLFLAADYMLALVGLFGLAAVPVITEHMAPEEHGWLRWTRTLAQLGFAVLAVTSFWQAEYEFALRVESLDLPASDSESLSPSLFSPSALIASWRNLISRAPQGWLELGGIGLWIVSVNWAVRPDTRLPMGLVWTGFSAGFFALFAATGAAFQLWVLHFPGLLLGSFLLMPLWFAWTGTLLLRSSRSLSS